MTGGSGASRALADPRSAFSARAGRIAREVTSWIAAGAVAGFLALGLDLLLARLMTAVPSQLAADFVLAYPATGAAVGLVIPLAGRLLRFFRRSREETATPSVPFLARASWVFGLLYVFSLGERAHRELEGLPSPARWGSVVLAGAAYLGLVAALGAVVGCRRIGRDGLRPSPLAPALAGLCVALGLAVNRFLIHRPFGAAALAADLAIVLSVFGLALLGRRRPILPLACVAVAVLLASGAAWLRLGPLPEDVAGDGAILGAAGRPPHLLLLVFDTLRQDVFREVLATTPEGERLRRVLGGAAYFDDATAVAPWTVPSMGTILTGLYPQEHGFVASGRRKAPWAYRHLSPEATTLAERLSARGYWNEAIVANPILHTDTGIERGFDEYRLMRGPTVRLPLLTALVRLGWVRAQIYAMAAAVEARFRQRLDPVLTACDEAGRPAFFWIHLMDPHLPLQPHPTYEEDRRALRRATERRAAAETGERGGIHPAEIRYRGEVRYAVRHAAEMIEALQQRVGRDDLLLVLVADHGEMLPGDRPGVERRPPLHAHGHVLYDPLVRIPLVIRPPGGLDEPRQVDALVSHADLHDTILDLLGIEEGRIGRDRRSLAPLLRGETGIGGTGIEGREWALVGHTGSRSPQRALRVPGRKLIVWEGEGPELYDLERDPQEVRDLSAEQAEEVRALRGWLDRIWAGLEETEATEDVELDAETRRRLEALGYL